MTRFNAILAAVLKLHGWCDRSEPAADWQIRARGIASAIEDVTRDNSEAATMIEILRAESRASLAVHRGRIKWSRGFQYRGMWQVSKSAVDPSDWRAMASSDLDAAALVQARVAIEIWRICLRTASYHPLKAHLHYMGSSNRRKAAMRLDKARAFERELNKMMMEAA